MQPERRVLAHDADGVVLAHVGIRRMFVTVGGEDVLVGDTGLVAVSPRLQGTGRRPRADDPHRTPSSRASACRSASSAPARTACRSTPSSAGTSSPRPSARLSALHRRGRRRQRTPSRAAGWSLPVTAQLEDWPDGPDLAERPAGLDATTRRTGGPVPAGTGPPVCQVVERGLRLDRDLLRVLVRARRARRDRGAHARTQVGVDVRPVGEHALAQVVARHLRDVAGDVADQALALRRRRAPRGRACRPGRSRRPRRAASRRSADSSPSRLPAGGRRRPRSGRRARRRASSARRPATSDVVEVVAHRRRPSSTSAPRSSARSPAAARGWCRRGSGARPRS